MKRKVIQDVIPPKEIKTIRNIPIPQRVVRQESAIKTVQKEEIKETEGVKISLNKDNKNKGFEPTIPSLNSQSGNNGLRKIFIILGAILLISGSYFIYLFLNTGAVVTITPKEKEIVLNESFVSKKNPNENELGFEVISLVETMEKAVPTTGEKRVDKKSKGEIVIYNDYNSQPQRLIKNTRFETSEGLIYRLESSVVVPGQTKKDGQTIPGSISVVVVADEAGEKYNVDLKDFTIPGFKGDPRYENFYARSKTPMTGGFSGVIKTASASDIEIARKELTAVLREKVKNSVNNKVPAGFILYDDALFISFETISNPEDSNVSIKASANAIIFSKDTLSSNFAKLKVGDYRGEDVTSTLLNKLSLKIDPKESTPWLTGVFPISFSGTTTITWIIDSEKLKNDLIGVPKNFVNDIFKNYIGIEKAEVSLTPSWKSVFPEDVSKIEIKIKNNI